MIRKERDELVAECNDCGTELTSGTLAFRDFVQSLKDDGWRVRKEDDEWQHFCPECVEAAY